MATAGGGGDLPSTGSSGRVGGDSPVVAPSLCQIWREAAPSLHQIWRKGRWQERRLWRRPGGGRGGEAVAVVEKSGAEDDALDVNVCDVLFMTFLKFLHVLFLGDVDDYVMVRLKPFLSLFKKKILHPHRCRMLDRHQNKEDLRCCQIGVVSESDTKGSFGAGTKGCFFIARYT